MGAENGEIEGTTRSHPTDSGFISLDPCQPADKGVEEGGTKAATNSSPAEENVEETASVFLDTGQICDPGPSGSGMDFVVNCSATPDDIRESTPLVKSASSKVLENVESNGGGERFHVNSN